MSLPFLRKEASVHPPPPRQAFLIPGSAIRGSVLAQSHLHQHIKWQWVQSPFEATLPDAQPRALGSRCPGLGVLFWGSTESLTATHQLSLCSYESVRASLESGTCFKGVWSNECFYRNKYFALCLPLITCDCTFLLRTELREKKHFI